MKVLYSMLKEFLPEVPEAQELKEKIFPEIGLEVEDFKDLSRGLAGKLVAGVVLEIEIIEGNLKLLRVSTGQSEIRCLSTSPVEPRETIFIALPGAVLAQGQEVKSKKIKGHISEAMPVSEQELGLAETSESIIRLRTTSLKPGDDPLDYLQLRDYLFDLFIFPNRGDLMSAWGIARELGPVVGTRPAMPEPHLDHEPDIGVYPVEIRDEQACPRYTARVIRGTSVVPAPSWMRYRLALLGQRPINNIVDASNYVNFWLGHPTHTFDLAQLHGKIIVRRAQNQESMLMLDEAERVFDQEILLIADEKRPLAVAGVMGGEGSGVSHETQNVLVESAFFEPARVAFASRKLRVLTESSRRFERGTDPEIPPVASKWVSKFILDTGGGSAGPLNDVGQKEFPKSQVFITQRWLSQLAGVEVPEKEMIKICQHLGLEPKQTPQGLELQVPAYRHDLKIKQDIAEDILKFWGYQHIPEDKPTISNLRGELPKDGFTRARQLLSGAGFYEAKNLGLHSPSEIEAWAFEPDKLVRVMNPLGEDFSVLRPSLLPGLVKSVAVNLNRFRGGVRLFEPGPVFTWRGPDQLPEERWLLGLAVAGKLEKRVLRPERELDQWDLKAGLEMIWANRGFDMRPCKRPWFVPGSCWEILVDQEPVGEMGLIMPRLCHIYDLKAKVWVAQFPVPEPEQPKFKGIHRFPPVRRDIALLVDQNTVFADVLDDIKANAQGPVSVRPLDIYQGKNIPQGKVSLAFRLVWQADRTLSDKEVNQWFGDLMQKLREKGYHIREA